MPRAEFLQFPWRPRRLRTRCFAASLLCLCKSMSLPPLFLHGSRGAKGRRRGWLCRLLCCLSLHCETSDPIWEAYSETRSPSFRGMIVPVFRAAQATAILPPPPGRLRWLQALAAIVLMCVSNAASQHLTFDHVQNVLERGFQLSLHAYLVESTMLAVQTPIILLVYWANLSRAAPVLGAVMAPAGPLHPAPSFVVAITALTFLSHVTSQALLCKIVSLINENEAYFAVIGAWSSFCPLVMDQIVSTALTLAALKIRVLNRRLSSLHPTAMKTMMTTSPSPTLEPTVQRGLVQGVANRWEATMEQMSALLGHDMLGLPLLFSLLQISVGLVTSTADIWRQTEDLPYCIYMYRVFTILTCLTMVASLAVTAGWLFREAKQTETILGALDTTAWPIRERHRVRHLLRLSRETKQFRVCGLVSLDQSLLFTIMGNTVTFVVMLIQIPILTPGKAADKLNQTEAKAAAAAAAAATA